MKMNLNTQRKVDYDQAKEHTFGDDTSLKEKLAIALLNPDDIKSLNISQKSHIKIISKYGSIIVAVKEEKDVPPRTIIMPVSIWANQITGMEEKNLVFKNIEVDVEITEEAIPGIDNLLNKIKNS